MIAENKPWKRGFCYTMTSKKLTAETATDIIKLKTAYVREDADYLTNGNSFGW